MRKVIMWYIWPVNQIHTGNLWRKNRLNILSADKRCGLTGFYMICCCVPILISFYVYISWVSVLFFHFILLAVFISVFFWVVFILHLYFHCVFCVYWVWTENMKLKCVQLLIWKYKIYWQVEWYYINILYNSHKLYSILFNGKCTN